MSIDDKAVLTTAYAFNPDGNQILPGTTTREIWIDPDEWGSLAGSVVWFRRVSRGWASIPVAYNCEGDFYATEIVGPIASRADRFEIEVDDDRFNAQDLRTGTVVEFLGPWESDWNDGHVKTYATIIRIEPDAIFFIRDPTLAKAVKRGCARSKAFIENGAMIEMKEQIRKLDDEARANPVPQADLDALAEMAF